jgi:sec-independent protein translocase protein TatA
MFGLRLPELLLILVVLLVLFGANRLPQLGAGLGHGIKSFRKAFGGTPEETPPEGEGKAAPPANAPPKAQRPRE